MDLAGDDGGASRYVFAGGRRRGAPRDPDAAGSSPGPLPLAMAVALILTTILFVVVAKCIPRLAPPAGEDWFKNTPE